MNLYILPFDHRHSFVHDLYHLTPPLSAEQTAQIAQAKDVIYQGFLQAGVPTEQAGILVDEQFGAALLADAKKRGYGTACPVEKSGQDEFDFEYGPGWQAHIERVDPTYVKALVRYNPQGDAGVNAAQQERLAALSKFLRASGRKLMFELLVPALPAQLAAVGQDIARYDNETRPDLMVQAMHALQDAGIEPDIWKVEGVDTPEAAASLVRAAQRGGREASLIVLGRDANDAQVTHWSQVAARTPGFVGFAVGRTTFEDALRRWIAGEWTAQQASEHIAQLYLKWVQIYRAA